MKKFGGVQKCKDKRPRIGFQSGGTVLFLSKGTKMVSANYIFMSENPHKIVSESVCWVNEDVSVVNLAIFFVDMMRLSNFSQIIMQMKEMKENHY